MLKEIPLWPREVTPDFQNPVPEASPGEVWQGLEGQSPLFEKVVYAGTTTMIDMVHKLGSRVACPPPLNRSPKWFFGGSLLAFGTVLVRESWACVGWSAGG